ncbi:MAG: hypothetical protein DRN08_03045 [Thermoplasmata archaeon]|nr:MAG: hypothetical protein DRN08_03045 [Thermoplasmata archaeon]
MFCDTSTFCYRVVFIKNIFRKIVLGGLNIIINLFFLFIFVVSKKNRGGWREIGEKYVCVVLG